MDANEAQKKMATMREHLRYIKRVEGLPASAQELLAEDVEKKRQAAITICRDLMPHRDLLSQFDCIAHMLVQTEFKVY